MYRVRSHRAGGFTLVEALGAASVLALAGSMIGVGVSSSLSSLTVARDRQRAAEVLDGLMTRIDLIGPARIQLEGPTDGTLDDGWNWSVDIEQRIEADLFDVTLEVSWPTAGGTRSAKVYTRLNDPPLSRSPLLRWQDL